MKCSLLLSFLLSAVMWLPAQNPPSGSPNPSQNSGSVTVVGCVVAQHENYVLNANGKHYQLTGTDVSFQQYIGKKVRAVGTESYSKKPGTGGKAENMLIRADSPTLTVSKIEKLADSCSDSH